MSQVDLHVCVCMCVREREGTLRLTDSLIEGNIVAVCREQTVRCTIFLLEHWRKNSNPLHIWELVIHHLILYHLPLLFAVCSYFQTSPPCSNLLSVAFSHLSFPPPHLSTVPPWILVA